MRKQMLETRQQQIQQLMKKTEEEAKTADTHTHQRKQGALAAAKVRRFDRVKSLVSLSIITNRPIRACQT